MCVLCDIARARLAPFPAARAARTTLPPPRVRSMVSAVAVLWPSPLLPAGCVRARADSSAAWTPAPAAVRCAPSGSPQHAPTPEATSESCWSCTVARSPPPGGAIGEWQGGCPGARSRSSYVSVDVFWRERAGQQWDSGRRVAQARAGAVRLPYCCMSSTRGSLWNQ